jgi:hypothetical protein
MNKKIILTTFFLALLRIVSPAQENGITFTSIKQNDKIVEFTITSQTHFHVGGNLVVLHIGDKVFTKSQQKDEGDISRLTFYIPSEEFQELADGQDMLLAYAYQNEQAGTLNETERASTSQPYAGKQWELGKLNKQLQKK